MAKKLHTIAILFAALAITTGAQQPTKNSRTWAVVIGISKYQKLPGGQHLQFADRDAVLFSEAIQKRGVSDQNVKLLTGADATSAAIKSAVGNWLARSVSESDTVLIFFSGHGLVEREFGESYLLGYDSDPKDPYGTALSISELGQALARRVRSGRVLIIADAVRRDFFDPESDPALSNLFEQAFDQLTSSRPGLSTIIASGPGEFSREGQRWGGHGVFAKHLADVLFDGTSRNADLAVAGDELFELLKGRVAEDTSGKQHPWRRGNATGLTAVTRLDRQAGPPVAASKSEPAAATSPNPGALSKSTDENKKPGPVEASDKKAQPAPTIAAEKKADPALNAALKEKKPELPPVVASTKKADPIGAPTAEKNAGATQPAGPEKPPSSVVAPRATAASGKPVTVSPPAKSPAPPGSAPTGTETASGKKQPVGPSIDFEPPRREIPPPNLPPPPKPAVNPPPSAVVVSSDRASAQPEALTASVPSVRPEAAPSPLVLQLEAAIASRNLIEPRNASAWDLYQRMLSEPGTAADANRLKPALADALTAQGRAIVSGDVRGDNVSDIVDDFKRAGQMLARARTLTPGNGDVIALEKLSAAAALLSLQFYDEAERALAPLQDAKLAAVENALGLVYQGKLDSWRAERAFKRASELDSKWAAPHYNLALVYKSQQNQAALAEFESAALCDQGNVNLLAALGDEYFTRQQWKQAAEAFRKAVALKPSDDNLHTKLGHALYSQGLQDEANREYQKAQELRRKRP